MTTFIELTTDDGEILVNTDKIITAHPIKGGTAIALDRVVLNVRDPYDTIKTMLNPIQPPKAP